MPVNGMQLVFEEEDGLIRRDTAARGIQPDRAGPKPVTRYRRLQAWGISDMQVGRL